MPFKPGKSGNPKGRTPIILPEVQRAVEANRNALKVIIMQKLDEKTINEWIDWIIKTGTHEGDVQKFKILTEMAMGKMIEDSPEFPLTEDEKLLVLEFRRRKALAHERSINGESETTSGD